MAGYERAARRRAQRGVPRRGPQNPGHYDASVWEALPSPEPGAPDHVILRLGVGPADQLPAAYLELCSHGVERFIADLRLAVEVARETGELAVVPGGSQ